LGYSQHRSSREAALAAQPSDYRQAAYDRVADVYDELFGDRVQACNAALTAGLGLQPGERCLDLACGTGRFTVEMAQAVAPAEVVGVDFSENMLAGARQRAQGRGLENIQLVHAKAEDFILACPPGSFDVVSMRFALAYLDWPQVVPHMGAMVRPGGRVGIATSLAGSLPQLYQLYRDFRTSLGPYKQLYRHTGGSLPDTVRLISRLRSAFGDDTRLISIPDSPDTLGRCMEKGGLVVRDTFTDRVRMWYPSGAAVSRWLDESGYVTHQTLERVGEDALRFLAALFADGMERFREPEGIPLDLVVAGVIAEKR
jgi:ubiquinone/menaquinone biosynthesis C-methylase UbiE